MAGAAVPRDERAATGATPSRFISPRDAVVFVAAAALYLVAARLSLLFALVEHNVTPIWPPTGIALAAFLLFGRRLWPAVFVAALAVNAPISETWWAALGTAVGNTAAPLLAATLLRWAGFRIELDRSRDAVALVGIAALPCMALSATVGTAMLVLSDAVASSRTISTWLVWWAGDAMGVLLVAPFLFALTTPARGPWTRRRRIEAIALAVVVSAISVVVVTTSLPLLFLLIVPVGIAAWRFQLHGAAPAALIASGAATWAASVGRGPFDMGRLVQDMLVLQALNASLAVASFVFASVVADRARAREELERGAAELEQRVRDRTLELTRANERLEHEIAEREEVETRLRRNERLLSQAQEIARVGSYRWDLGTGEVRWSDELYRIHGHEPEAFPVTLEVALAQVVPEDRARISANIRHAIERHEGRLPDVEYRIVRPDGEIRVVQGSARLAFDADGRPTEMVGSVHDVTDQRTHEREHEIAETLQRALLPQVVRPIEGVAVATRYLSAEEDAHAGGDWYDVIELDDDRVAFVIGDVAGHGVPAASAMGRARMTLRAYALAGGDPAEVVRLTGDVLDRVSDETFVTLLYLELEIATGRARLVVAGHPPPLVVSAGGGATYVEAEPGLPLGLALGSAAPYVETAFALEPGATLFLYTDGLVDRPDLLAIDGFDRLRDALDAAAGDDLERLCDDVLSAMSASTSGDDIALVCLRRAEVPADLHLEIPADPSVIADVRAAIRTWLAGRTDGGTIEDIVLASSEAVANAVEHAYRDREPGSVVIGGTIRDGELVLTIRDDGRWAESQPSDRGRGTSVIQALVDDVEVERRDDGTEVRLRRSLHPARQAGDELASALGAGAVTPSSVST